ELEQELEHPERIGAKRLKGDVGIDRACVAPELLRCEVGNRGERIHMRSRLLSTGLCIAYVTVDRHAGTKDPLCASAKICQLAVSGRAAGRFKCPVSISHSSVDWIVSLAPRKCRPSSRCAFELSTNQYREA